MLVSAFSRVLPFLFIGLLVWPFTASAATLDDIVEEFPIVGASIDDIEESAHPDAEISGSVTGAVVVDGAAAQNPVPETDMWRVADVPESIVTPGAVDQWNVYRWGDVRVRIRLRGVDGGGYAADQDGGATLITDPGAGLEHAVYVANEGMVEEFLVLDSDAAGNETGRTFVWDVEGLPSDWSMKETAPGSVVLFDEGEGERRMEITAPVVQDEVGRRLLSNFGLDPASQTLRLTIDTSLAQGSVVADPVFFLNGSGELQQNFCRGGISDCSVVDNNAPPNFFQGNVNDGWFFYGSTYATGPAVIAVGAPPAGYTGAAIYQPGSYLGLKSFNVYGGTVRTGYQNFECTIHARKGGAYWAEIANSAVTVDGPVSSQVYYRSFPFTAHPVNPTTQYLDMAAVVLRARTGVHGGSNNGCTLDQNGIIYATLADSSGPQQNTGGAPDAGTNGATFSQSTWYGPANPMPQFLARFTDQGSGIGTLQPIITTKNGSAAEINALYTNNLPHPSFVFCRGFNVGASNTDVRPCWLQPTMPIGVGLPPATMLETSSTKHNYFQWKVWDFSANYSFGTKVEVKWDKTIPVKPATVSDGSGLDVDAAPPTNPMAFTWSVGTDATAGVGGYRYCVDQSQDIVTNAQYGGQWCASSFVETTTGPMTSPSASATLPSLAHGAAYSICVRTIDRANNQSGGNCSDGFVIDARPPAAIGVVDGLGDTDEDVTGRRGSGSWAFPDASGVDRYEYCFVAGSSCSSGSSTGWLDAGIDSGFPEIGDDSQLNDYVHDAALPVASGTVRLCVRSVNGAGLASQETCSDGAVIDSAAPAAPAVADVGEPDGGGGIRTAASLTFAATWPDVADTSTYEYCVVRVSQAVTDCDDVDAASVGWRPTTVTSMSVTASDGVPGGVYKVCVRAADEVSNWSAPGCSTGQRSVASTDDIEEGVAFRRARGWNDALSDADLATSVEEMFEDGGNAIACGTVMLQVEVSDPAACDAPSGGSAPAAGDGTLDSFGPDSLELNRCTECDGTFSRTAASKYAKRYWGPTTDDYNDHYRVYAQDCTNFMSQALTAGGWTETGSQRNSNYDWFYGHLAATTSYTWAGTKNLRQFMLASGRAYLVPHVNNIKIGDVLFASIGSLEGDVNKIGHAMIVTRVVNPVTGARDVRLAGHTNNRLFYALSAITARSSIWVYAPYPYFDKG